MSELFEKSIRVLELPRLLERLERHAVSADAKARARKLTPSDDYGEVNRLLDETDAARKMIALRGSPSFGGVRPVAEALGRAERDGMLNTRELLDIAALLTNVRRVKDYYREDEEGTVIDKLFLSLHPNRFLEEKITTAILDENEIADNASPELAEIRRHKRAAAAKGRQILQRIISSPSYRNVLQDALITQRGGRFVVPVKAECRGELPGLVHDTSSSGATIFVEPMGVVQANNEMKELEAKEDKEIDRILRVLSGECAAARETILYNYDVLVQLDAIFARAQLSYAMNAGRPLVRKRGGIDLKKARHPLLDQARAVPVTVELGGRFDTLVITGPNTGGKTVTLKTIGLLSLMAQCGLHIPAGDQSAVQVFDRILADVGDEQSIEQSLSTFSSHMTNVVSFLDKADRNSLVLFDELGAGTDPTEGAALAIAILSTLHERGIRTMATTHYSELKIYALSTPGVENACCEFDVETLSPTYRLLVGVPGKSNAFAISSKLGLPDYIINKAKDEISEQDESFEDVLTTLEQNRITLEREKEELARTRAEVESLKQSLAKNQEQIDARKEKMISNATEEAQRILREAKEYADQTMRDFQKFGKENVSVREMEQKRTALREKMNKLDKKKTKEVPKRTGNLRPQDLHLGDAVKVLSMNLKGTVSTRPDSKGNLFVQMGIMRTKVHISDLVLIDEAVITGPSISRTSSGKSKLSKAATISTEINLLGKTVDEAVAELDKYLDDAYLSHLPSVRVVHGKGTGALRKGIHNYLRRQKHVADFHLAEFGEGDAGVTIVTFKK